MKKILCLLLSILIITGCEVNDRNKGENNNMKDKSSNELVLYFSATNNTKRIALEIKDIINADIVEIIPKEKYTNEDLNYNKDCRANREMNDINSRPEILNEINIDNYDTIYLGYPIWWGTSPRIILTLIDKYNFDDKNIILFCTSGGSEISKSVADLKKYNNKMNIIDSKTFNSNTKTSEIESWLNNINN